MGSASVTAGRALPGAAAGPPVYNRRCKSADRMAAAVSRARPLLPTIAPRPGTVGAAALPPAPVANAARRAAGAATAPPGAAQTTSASLHPGRVTAESVG